MFDVLELAQAMIAVDTRSSVSNCGLLGMLEDRLDGWDRERIDYKDDDGVAKANLVARHPKSSSRLVFAGHLDTVPAAGWTTDPFKPAIIGDRLFGLGAADMKGPVAAFLCAVESVDPSVRPMIVLTADEESTKRGVREVVAKSSQLRTHKPDCFVVCEPTQLGIVRGHRVDVQFVVKAHGVQAHSSTGLGLNANIGLIPFLSGLRVLHLKLRQDLSLHDPQYDPPFCDLNFVIDNHGTPPNTTVGLATCRIKFRYSKSFNPEWVIAAIVKMATESNLEIAVRPESPPPELAPNAPEVLAFERLFGSRATVMGLGTEASEYSRLAPSIIFGPGNLDDAHKPAEGIDVRQLRDAVDAYRRIAERLTI